MLLCPAIDQVLYTISETFTVSKTSVGMHTVHSLSNPRVTKHPVNGRDAGVQAPFAGICHHSSVITNVEDAKQARAGEYPFVSVPQSVNT